MKNTSEVQVLASRNVSEFVGHNVYRAFSRLKTFPTTFGEKADYTGTNLL